MRGRLAGCRVSEVEYSYYGGKAYPGYKPELLFEKLGLVPDWEKIRYYILLDELF